MNLRQVSECLKQAGHEVLNAHRFDAATRILDNQKLDLIVSDVHLQNGGNIFDLLVRLHSNPIQHDIAFVCFSFQPTELAEYLAAGVQTAASTLGAASYITMTTFDAEGFRTRIEQVLSKRQNCHSGPNEWPGKQISHSVNTVQQVQKALGGTTMGADSQVEPI